jgi:Lar family restriction alleviation protein
MSPFNAGEFTDMDGKEVEEAGEPRSCPFCGSGADQLVVERWSSEDDPDASDHVECLKCGCNGPQAERRLEAAREWNGRAG